MSDITTARRELERAEAKLAAAKRACDEARDQLDIALAGRGWSRMFGAFDARLYMKPGGNPVPLGEVLDHQTRSAA